MTTLFSDTLRKWLGLDWQPLDWRVSEYEIWEDLQCGCD